MKIAKVKISEIANHPTKRMDAEYWVNKNDNKIDLTKKELKLIKKSLVNRVNSMGVDEVRTYESILEKIEKII